MLYITKERLRTFLSQCKHLCTLFTTKNKEIVWTVCCYWSCAHTYHPSHDQRSHLTSDHWEDTAYNSLSSEHLFYSDNSTGLIGSSRQLDFKIFNYHILKYLKIFLLNIFSKYFFRCVLFQCHFFITKYLKWICFLLSSIVHLLV